VVGFRAGNEKNSLILVENKEIWGFDQDLGVLILKSELLGFVVVIPEGHCIANQNLLRVKLANFEIGGELTRKFRKRVVKEALLVWHFE
jgi:hypothetical protein|tara:strand:- start:478 stop:744 length:267 start_codon:yes stop_codon:yes gene_type:complete